MEVKEVDRLLSLLEVYKSQCKYYALYKLSDVFINGNINTVYLSFAGEEEGLSFYHAFVVTEDKAVVSVSVDLAFVIGLGIDRGKFYPCVDSSASNHAEALKSSLIRVVEEYFPDYVDYFKGMSFIVLE